MLYAAKTVYLIHYSMKGAQMYRINTTHFVPFKQSGNPELTTLRHSFKDKILTITIEPVVLLFAMAKVLPSALLTNLILQRVS